MEGLHKVAPQNNDGNPESMKCNALGETPVVCTFSKVIRAYEQLELRVAVVLAPGASPGEENRASVSGGGAPLTKTVARPLQIGGHPRFGVEENTLTAEEAGGAVDTQAGSHPFQVTNLLTFNHGAFTSQFSEGFENRPVEAAGGNVLPNALPKDQSGSCHRA